MKNKEKYKKVFNVLATSEQLHLEVDMITNKKSKTNRMKYVAAVVAICVILVGAGTGVYAAMTHFGIVDFRNRFASSVPEEAKQQIQTDIEMNQDENDTIFEMTLLESLCDSETITLVYEVSAKETGKYLFVPEDAFPEDDMCNWSDIENISAKDYAAQNNLTIVNIGGGIENREELEIVDASMDFRSVKDDVMDVYVRCNVENSTNMMEVDAVATGIILGNQDVMRLVSHFELQDLSTTEKTLYTNIVEADSNAFYRIEKVEVIQTDLGTYVDIYYINNEEDDDMSLSFHVMDDEGNIIEMAGGRASNLEGNHYKERQIFDKTEFGDSISLEAYDWDEKNIYGTIKILR